MKIFSSNGRKLRNSRWFFFFLTSLSLSQLLLLSKRVVWCEVGDQNQTKSNNFATLSRTFWGCQNPHWNLKGNQREGGFGSSPEVEDEPVRVGPNRWLFFNISSQNVKQVALHIQCTIQLPYTPSHTKTSSCWEINFVVGLLYFKKIIIFVL